MESEDVVVIGYIREPVHSFPCFPESVFVVSLHKEAVDPVGARPVPDRPIVENLLELLGGAERQSLSIPGQAEAESRSRMLRPEVEGFLEALFRVGERSSLQTEKPEENPRLCVRGVSADESAQQFLCLGRPGRIDQCRRAPEKTVQILRSQER